MSAAVSGDALARQRADMESMSTRQALRLVGPLTPQWTVYLRPGTYSNGGHKSAMSCGTRALLLLAAARVLTDARIAVLAQRRTKGGTDYLIKAARAGGRQD